MSTTQSRTSADDLCRLATDHLWIGQLPSP
jgi:hypothetical protein